MAMRVVREQLGSSLSSESSTKNLTKNVYKHFLSALLIAPGTRSRYLAKKEMAHLQ